MDDPRIDELMEYVDAVDENGEPTSMAMIARRVATYVESVTESRDQISALHSDVETLETRADSLSAKVEEQKSHHDELAQNAQVAARLATTALNTGQGARLRKDAVEKRKILDQYEGELAEGEKRLSEVMRALQARRQTLVETRDQIARRMNTIDALLKRAEIEWPQYTLDENKRLKGSGSSESSAVRRRRPVGRGRKRIIRRRKAG